MKTEQEIKGRYDEAVNHARTFATMLGDAEMSGDAAKIKEYTIMLNYKRGLAVAYEDALGIEIVNAATSK